MPLLDIKTDDPDPSYLRIAVLTQFNGVEWTPGDRQIVSDQVADGLVPLEVPELSNSVPIDSYNYTVTASKDFQSTLAAHAVPGLRHRGAGRLALRHHHHGLPLQEQQLRRGSHLHDDRGQARSSPAGRWRTR